MKKKIVNSARGVRVRAIYNVLYSRGLSLSNKISRLTNNKVLINLNR